MKILAFGEIMLRLSAGDKPITQCTTFDACYGGTEANVLACLANFGHQVQYLTALPDSELGNAVLQHLHNFNVDTSKVIMRGDTLGLYFVENGTGSRGSNVVYMRKHSEVAKLSVADVDFNKVFEGVGLFHISGISFALSQSSRELAFKLMQEARARNIPVSFDFNYRSKLWTTDRAAPVLSAAANLADIVLCSSLDLTTFLKTTAQQYVQSRDLCLVVRNRRVVNANRHSVQVDILRSACGKVEKYSSAEEEFEVKEKIGGGDTFDGAILHKILQSASLQQTVEFALAAFELKHLVVGDTFTLKEQEVNNFAATRSLQ